MKTFKKTTMVFLTTIILIAGSALNVNATSPVLFEFGTWMGSGSISVNVEIGNVDFEKLTYKDTEVDSSNYIITSTEGNFVITLNENYLKTLSNGEYNLWAYFSNEIQVVLKLIVDVNITVSTTSSTTIQTTSSVVSTDAYDSPNTGSDGFENILLVIMILSFVGCAVVLLSSKNKNTIKKWRKKS